MFVGWVKKFSNVCWLACILGLYIMVHSQKETQRRGEVKGRVKDSSLVGHGKNPT